MGEGNCGGPDGPIRGSLAVTSALSATVEVAAGCIASWSGPSVWLSAVAVPEDNQLTQPRNTSMMSSHHWSVADAKGEFPWVEGSAIGTNVSQFLFQKANGFPQRGRTWASLLFDSFEVTTFSSSSLLL